MNRLLIATLIATLALAGCTRQRSWQDYDAGGVPFARGSAQCKYEAQNQSSSSTSSSMSGLPQINGDIYVACMMNRGY